MLKYVKNVDKNTGLCSEVGIGTNEEFYKSIGMTLQDVEQAYNGQWYLADKVPTQPFEELKENKLAELKNAANKFEQNVCKDMVITSSLGFPVDADKRSQDNMRGLLDVMSVAKLSTVAYRCADDQMRELSTGKLKTILVEALTNGQNLYTQKWQLEAAINAAENKEQLDAISIEFVMSDFSNAQS